MILDEVLKVHREFIKKMHGIAPNRVLMNGENAEVFKNELRELNKHRDLCDPAVNWTVHGMRLVVDPWVAGIEVAYAR